jgi:hypothetical protein
MQITLRRAAQLQAEIQREIAGIDLSTTAVIQAYRVTGTDLQDAVTKFENNVNLALNLNSILHKIRAAVGQANINTGISELLANDAGARAQQQLLAKILTQTQNCPTQAVWDDMYQAMLTRLTKADTRFVEDQISYSLLTAVNREKFQQQLIRLRRQRNNISDQLLAINTRNTIEIADSDWAVLQNLGLV